MNTLYSTSATAVGGRNGTARSDDGLLDLQLAVPQALGGQGGATNPEQLFAAGYAACFANAVVHVSRGTEWKVRDRDVQAKAVVGLLSNEQGGFVLTVSMEVTVAGVEPAAAEKLVALAHAACPYSNAVKGNIDVAIVVKTAE